MSMIKNLVDKLRLYADEYKKPPWGKEIDGTKELLRQAADTIEELSAKVARRSMDRSSQYYGGGWITDRNPTKEECGKYGKNI